MYDAFSVILLLYREQYDDKRNEDERVYYKQ